MALTDARQAATLSVLVRPKCGQRGQVTKSARSAANCQGVVDSPAASSPRSQALSVWMQTTGAALLAAERRSIVRLRVPVQDGRSAHGLLYLAAVQDDQRQQEHCQPRLDVEPSSGTLAVAHSNSSLRLVSPASPFHRLLRFTGFSVSPASPFHRLLRFTGLSVSPAYPFHRPIRFTSLSVSPAYPFHRFFHCVSESTPEWLHIALTRDYAKLLTTTWD
jgi:hypothetical protein